MAVAASRLDQRRVSLAWALPVGGPAMTTETLPVVVPFEPTTPIKPSEAIRLGCLIAPVQTFREYRGDDSACALAAMELGGFAYDDQPLMYLPCPLGCKRDGGSGSPFLPKLATWATPAHLNDDHRWSRERIADWLAGLGL